MRSRDSVSRRALERTARVAAIVLIAVALWRAFDALNGSDSPRLHADMQGALEPVTRDSLAAIAAAGTSVTWSGAPAPIAVMAEPVREPAADSYWRVAVIAPSLSILRDTLGTLDSLGAGGGAVTAASVRGALDVQSGSTTASTAAAEDATIGRVFVFGRAGWESKFVIAALEEQGWEVDARVSIGTDVDITQGTARTPNIARHAAVVVLDTTVGREAAAIARFVRAGGGLVMAGEGAAAPSLQSHAPARVTRVEAPEAMSFQGHEPTHALALHVLGGLRAGSVVLEDRAGTPAVAAQRVGAGRVVQMGYAETWRWRMQGEGASVKEHRAYWSRLVASAAAATYAAREPSRVAWQNAAPLAQAMQALGAPIDAPDRVTAGARRGTQAFPFWMVPLILALLVGEWASRRTRGAA